MGWNCQVCTFQNRPDQVERCEICHTARGQGLHNDEAAPSFAAAAPDPRPASIASSAPKKTVQSTLFGERIIVAASNNTVANTKQTTTSRKRKAPPPPPPAAVQPQQKPEKMPMATLVCSASCGAAKTNWTLASYGTLKANAEKALKQVFGIQKLRNLQPAAVRDALKRQSQIVVMATGSGKSLCYQLPAVVLEGLTLVISPLIALMKDQVEALMSKGVEAAVISSSNGERHNLDVLERILGRSLRKTNARKKSKPISTPQQQPPIKILYCTPEQIQSERFRIILTELYQKQRLSLLAVDEAHCVSSWGHDFRPAFRKLDWFRQSFPTVPCMACTATATPKVIEDIKQTLLLNDAPCHLGTFNRDNIFYKVRYKDVIEAQGTKGGVIGDLIQFIQKRHCRSDKDATPCSGIVYVHTRKDTEMLASAIQRGTGIPTAGYHGGLKVAERSQVQEDWTQNKIPIVVATIAFGMGIDLAHVRYVVHWTMSKTLEGFYQESGRAGRDGLPSYSLLYYSRQDTSNFKYLIQVQNKPKDGNENLILRSLEALEKMDGYASTSGCRRCYLLTHFGETAEPNTICNKTCDYCLNPSKLQRAIGASSNPSLKTQWSSGVYEGPHTDKANYEDADWTVGSLSINHYTPDDNNDDSKPPSGFSKASSILDKYEAIECKQGESNGFVRFRPKSSASQNSSVPVVPAHLLSNLPDPLQHLEKKLSVPKKSSADYGAEAERLRDELEKAKAEREAKIQALQSKKARVPPPPPPSLFSLGKKLSHGKK